MSTGQRIMQKRKELGLSQEALGEQMGVSHQAIYKWESDMALPEVEKLVALAKFFDVSIGWLLGVEEEAAQKQTAESTLSPGQLEMVEQIVKGYIQSIPKPKQRIRWPWILAASVVLLFVLGHFSNRIDQLNSHYTSLQSSVNNITASVNSQIGGIASRVEEILKSQNQLTAEYGTELKTVDYRENTALISMKAVPKTYVDGMEAVFVLDNGSGPEEYPGVLAQSQTFTCEAVVTLSDCITVSVVFVDPDGTRQTQVLDIYEGILARSYVDLNIMDHAMYYGDAVTDGKLKLENAYISIDENSTGLAELKDCQIGIFRGRKLIAWAESCEKPGNFSGFYGSQFYRLPDMTIEDLQEGETIGIAALVTDSFGRQYMIQEVPYVVSGGELDWPDSFTEERDLDQWILE